MKSAGSSAQEIDEVVAFLCTLTDGFDPKNPSAYNVPAQCETQRRHDRGRAN